MAAPFTSPPIAVPAAAREGRFDRADIVVEGLEQAGPSFRAHLFLNNPAADAGTERTPEAGYAGALNVYAQGPAPGVELQAPPGGGAVAPITKNIIATEAVRAALRDAAELTVTVVPERGAPVPLHVGRVSIVFR
jgi:hypothetical protein